MSYFLAGILLGIGSVVLCVGFVMRIVAEVRNAGPRASNATKNMGPTPQWLNKKFDADERLAKVANWTIEVGVILIAMPLAAVYFNLIK